MRLRVDRIGHKQRGKGIDLHVYVIFYCQGKCVLITVLRGMHNCFSTGEVILYY